MLTLLARYYAEIGDYAATILDDEHQELARECAARLDDISAELSRQGKSLESVLAIPDDYELPNDLVSLSIARLYELYRAWPKRHRAAADAGQDALDFTGEALIVAELLTRTPANAADRLMIDHCATTYQNEIQNRSIIYPSAV